MYAADNPFERSERALLRTASSAASVTGTPPLVVDCMHRSISDRDHNDGDRGGAAVHVTCPRSGAPNNYRQHCEWPIDLPTVMSASCRLLILTLGLSRPRRSFLTSVGLRKAALGSITQGAKDKRNGRSVDVDVLRGLHLRDLSGAAVATYVGLGRWYTAGGGATRCALNIQRDQESVGKGRGQLNGASCSAAASSRGARSLATFAATRVDDASRSERDAHHRGDADGSAASAAGGALIVVPDVLLHATSAAPRAADEWRQAGVGRTTRSCGGEAARAARIAVGASEQVATTSTA